MKISDRTIYAVLPRAEDIWQVRRAGRIVSMHESKSAAIDFALKQKNAVIVVAPEPNEDEQKMKKRVGKATRSERMKQEVEKKEREHRERISLPADLNQPVQSNVAKSSSDEAHSKSHAAK